MKNKILTLLVCISGLWPLSFNASTVEQEQLPNWIDVEYSDVYNQAVSEYQLATVTVKNYGLWFANSDYDVSVEFDQSQLVLANTSVTNQIGDKTTSESPAVNISENNFEVSYQFYMQPNVTLDSIPVSVTKVKNGKDSKEQTIQLKANSNTTMTNYQVGKMSVGYAVDKYVDDGAIIEYNAHFKMISNPNNQDFVLTLKPNNMQLPSSEKYQITLTSSSGTIAEIDEANYQLKMKPNDEFDLNITYPADDVEAKDDRFDFFIFMKSDDQFVRINPMFYPSTLTDESIDTRFHRYVVIKFIIMAFFVFLLLLYVIATKKRKTEFKKSKSTK